MHYASLKHERLYRNTVRNKGYPARTLAALYLFTANKKLWRCWRQTVTNQGIEWAASRDVGDPGWEAYYLEQAALSLARTGKTQVTLHDLADQANYPQETLRLVITALWIARNDPRTITKIVICKGGTLIAC
jgi:hypothetical protein